MSIEASLNPNQVRDGSVLYIKICNLRDYIGKDIIISLMSSTAYDIHWLAFISGKVDHAGQVAAEYKVSIDGREAALYCESILVDQVQIPIKTITVSIANTSKQIPNPMTAENHKKNIEIKRDRYYNTPLGNSLEQGTIEHRAVVAVEHLLVSKLIVLPGIQIIPVANRPGGEDERRILDNILESLTWPTRISSTQWASLVQPERPWTAVVFPAIWERDMDTAAELVASSMNDLLAILGLNRGARGDKVATIIEQRQTDDLIKNRIYVGGKRYGGNLIGGMLAGEDQTGTLIQYAAIKSDSLMRLLVDLYSEALEDPSVDARYFRFWSILETLAGSLIPVGMLVTRTDGNLWPDGGTTSDAAPRVYQLLLDLIRLNNINESSIASPASTLYEAVRIWYGRRNATAHYGRFVPDDPIQQQKNWYAWANVTVIPTDTNNEYLRALRDAVGHVIKTRLMQIGKTQIL